MIAFPFLPMSASLLGGSGMWSYWALHIKSRAQSSSQAVCIMLRPGSGVSSWMRTQEIVGGCLADLV